jgi:hypothetical protein
MILGWISVGFNPANAVTGKPYIKSVVGYGPALGILADTQNAAAKTTKLQRNLNQI